MRDYAAEVEEWWSWEYEYGDYCRGHIPGVVAHPHVRGWYCKNPNPYHGGTSCPLVPTRWTRIKYILKGKRLPRWPS